MKRFVCHINNLLINSARVGKPLAVTGIILLLLILPAACDEDELSSEKTDNKGIEYTNVEYSKDGSEVRLYLDGVGVPKSRSQRAITTDLAKTAFDLIEVIFVNGSLTNKDNIARASWILGEPATIVNVDRNGATGVNYGNIYPAANGPAACIFVGRDYGKNKILLGVGKLTGTNTGGTTVTTNTTSVTFTISALQSGLLVGTETTATGVAFDSFTYYENNGAGNGGYDNRVSHDVLDGSGNVLETVKNSFRVTLGGVSYPVYSLPVGLVGTGGQLDDISRTVTYAKYKFSLASGYSDGIRYAAADSGTTPSGNTTLEKRIPRYKDDGKYKEPRNLIDTGSKITLRTEYGNSAGGAFQGSSGSTTNNAGGVLLRLNSDTKPGIIALNIEISVYMVSDTVAGRNDDLPALTWKIRSGLGSEFYSLDDGVSRGGCILFGVGITEGNFKNIEWTWFKGW